MIKTSHADAVDQYLARTEATVGLDATVRMLKHDGAFRQDWQDTIDTEALLWCFGKSRLLRRCHLQDAGSVAVLAVDVSLRRRRFRASALGIAASLLLAAVAGAWTLSIPMPASTSSESAGMDAAPRLVVLKGNVRNLALTRLSVNGFDVPVRPDGSWVARVPIRGGTREVRIRARDPNGQVVTRIVRVRQTKQGTPHEGS